MQKSKVAIALNVENAEENADLVKIQKWMKLLNALAASQNQNQKKWKWKMQEKTLHKI